MCKLSTCNLTKLEAIQARYGWSGEHDHLGPESLVGGGLLRHHRDFLVGFQVMPIFDGLVTSSASALTSYLSSGAPGMVVHVKISFLILIKTEFGLSNTS